MSDESELEVEERFAIVPEWLLDADISDCAVRLYAVLLRFGQSSGARMPGRSTLARRLRKKSTDTVDRAMRELVALGAVAVEHRYDGPQRLTNRYLVRTSRPRRGGEGGGRTNTATPAPSTGGSSAAACVPAAAPGRTNAARVAAPMRQNPEFLTESLSSPPSSPAALSWEAESNRLMADCGISDWAGFVDEIVSLRRHIGQPATRWSAPCLLAALQLAVRGRGWPVAHAAAALRAVAADASTRSPMRVAEAGPWWDEPIPAVTATESDELAAMEAQLADADGLRPALQRRAREQLTAERLPVTRATVVRRAHGLLLKSQSEVGAC